MRLLGGEEFDDLDGGVDTLAGYRSVLHGPRPEFRKAGSWQAELEGVIAELKRWPDDSPGAVAVGVPERDQVPEVVTLLERNGMPATVIGPDGPRRYDAVHVGTLHRFKGLEYQRIILAGICDSAIPHPRIEQFRVSDPLRYQRELKRARSLLFVAATRARDTLVVSWHGAPSPFLRVAG